MLRAGAALALAFLLSSCAGGVCPVRRWDDATRALEAYDAMRAPARVVRAEAGVDRRQGDQRVRGTILMILQRPDRVRFDAMAQFGPAAILTSDGTTFALTDLREERFLLGPTCPANVERLVGVPLEASEVVRLLLGEGPRIPAQTEDITCEGGTYRITRRGGGRVQVLELEVRQEDAQEAPPLQRLRLRRAEVRGPDGSLEWRASWDDYRVVEDPRGDAAARMGIAMPFRIRLEHPARGTDTLIRFESIELNVRVPSDAFVQEPRPGLSVEAATCE
jgi:outer membrane lipoprotein-sorting protein